MHALRFYERESLLAAPVQRTAGGLCASGSAPPACRWHIRFSYFSGDGHILEDELVSDTAVVRMCSAAFEAVWERSIPHAEYRPA